MNGDLGFSLSEDPRDYSNTTIYVPTRRAARALAYEFAKALQPQAILLPRIIPLGDPGDLEERAILASEALGLADNVPPAINDLERRLVLTRLVEMWRQSDAMRALDVSGDGFTIGGGFADSFSLAGELAGLIDEFTVESIDWRKIKDLPHGAYDQYWSITRSFLEIASEIWPKILTDDYQQLDPAERLNRLLRNEAQRLKAEPPNHPVIAAGSTGTVPATAELLSVIARLPKGAVILPGLDTRMDERGWTLVADQSSGTATTFSEAQPGHPQAALKRLIQHLRIDRSDVTTLTGDSDQASEKLAIRAQITSASARAAEATDDWPDMRKQLQARLKDGLEGLSIIDAADEREEALAIAVALRETLETSDHTAALITPDRALAQRVATELLRWGIVADDSSGTALSQMALGGFARLSLSCLSEDFSPVSVMSLLSHACYMPLLDSHDWAATLAAFEIAGLRGNLLADGLSGLAACFADVKERMEYRHASPLLKRIDPAALESAELLLTQFVQSMTEMDSTRLALTPLSDLAACHQRLIISLAGTRAETGSDAIALGKIFDSLTTNKTNPAISFSDYKGLFETLLAECVVPPSQPVQGRIKIWGLLEARLMEADRVVLGGLNEKMWPPDVRTDPFLNRTMRTELGLSSPERRIGQTGHDFAQALGSREVILSRAISVEGTPMIASRFLRRLDAFIGKTGSKALRESGAYLLQAARAADAAPPAQAIIRPEPRVPAAMHPSSLTVTEISTLYRDPYAIYAKHILKLSPLEPLAVQVDARDKGTIFHEILAIFIKETNTAWPDDPLKRLLDIGKTHFRDIAHLEKVSAFWWPVFVRVAEWFVEWETERRTAIVKSHTEVDGAITFQLNDGTLFKLSGRADRIDQLAGGGLAILDYKTGTFPSAPQVGSNFEPQLTLMAEIARQGLFRHVPAQEVLTLSYVSVGSDPGEKKIDFSKDFGTIEAVAERHIDGLKSFLNRLRSGEEGFASRRRPAKERDYGDFDHLARVKEWMSESEASE
jgi:ATP-dependent helicase/nuclease subunit B